MICKAHHCMVDGIAIAELGKLILDAEPFEDRGEAEPRGSRCPTRRATSASPAPSPTAPPTARRSCSRR